jgi:hypothetical protein
MGFARYVLVALPMFIVLAVLLKNHRLLGSWLVPSAGASLVLCAEFVSWRFVGRGDLPFAAEGYPPR